MEPRRPQGRRTGRSLRAGRPRWPQGWRGFPNTRPPVFHRTLLRLVAEPNRSGRGILRRSDSTRKIFRAALSTWNPAFDNAGECCKSFGRRGEQVGRGYATPRAPRSTWQGKALRRPSRCIPSRPRLSPVMKLRFPNPSFMGVAPRQRARGRVLGAEGAPRAARRLGHSVTPPNATKERGGR